MGFTGTDRFNAAWRELHQAATAHPLVLGAVIAVFGLLVITGLYLYSARNRGWGLRLALWPCALLLVFGAGWQWELPLLLPLCVGLLMAADVGWWLGGRWTRPWLRHGWRSVVGALMLGPFAAIRGTELRCLGWNSDVGDFLAVLDRWREYATGCRFGGLPGWFLVGSLVFLASVLLERRRRKAWPGPRWRAATIAVAAALPWWLNWYVAGCLDPFTAVDDNRIGRLRYQVWSRPGLARVTHRRDQVPLINQATMWGNVAAVRTLLNAGARVSTPTAGATNGIYVRPNDVLWRDARIVAAAWGEDEVLRLLLARFPPAPDVCAQAATAAAKRGQASTVKLLLEAKPELMEDCESLVTAAADSPALAAVLTVLLERERSTPHPAGGATVLGAAAALDSARAAVARYGRLTAAVESAAVVRRLLARPCPERF